jgi:hypothetical protein
MGILWEAEQFPCSLRVVVILHADWATNKPCFEVALPCCYSCLRFFVTTRDAHCGGASLSYLFCSSEYEASILYRTLAGIIPVVFLDFLPWAASCLLLVTLRGNRRGVCWGLRKRNSNGYAEDTHLGLRGWIPHEHEHTRHAQDSIG